MRFYYDSRRAGLGDLVNFLSYVYRSIEILNETSFPAVPDNHEIIICYKRTGHIKDLSDKIKVVKNILKTPHFYVPVLFCDTQIEYFHNDTKGHFRERIIPHNYWPAKNLNKKMRTNNVGLFFYISYENNSEHKKHKQGRWRKHISQKKAELIELYLKTEKNYNIIDIPYLEYKEQPVYGTTIGMEYDENSQLNYCNLVIEKLCECEFVIKDLKWPVQNVIVGIYLLKRLIKFTIIINQE